MVFRATACASARVRVLAVIAAKDDFFNNPRWEGKKPRAHPNPFTMDSGSRRNDGGGPFRPRQGFFQLAPP